MFSWQKKEDTGNLVVGDSFWDTDRFQGKMVKCVSWLQFSLELFISDNAFPVSKREVSKMHLSQVLYHSLSRNVMEHEWRVEVWHPMSEQGWRGPVKVYAEEAESWDRTQALERPGTRWRRADMQLSPETLGRVRTPSYHHDWQLFVPWTSSQNWKMALERLRFSLAGEKSRL